MDEIEVGGLGIAFERRGEGPPLVLLHGFVGDSREWRRQIDALSDEFTVVAWDAPGSGRSSSSACSRHCTQPTPRPISGCIGAPHRAHRRREDGRTRR